MLKEHDGVIVVDGGEHETQRILRCRGIDHLQAGDVGHPRFQRLGVLRCCAHARAASSLSKTCFADSLFSSLYNKPWMILAVRTSFLLKFCILLLILYFKYLYYFSSFIPKI